MNDLLFLTEADAAKTFDALMAERLSECFRVYPEVRGTFTQPRPGQVDKAVRIDRVLVPTAAAREMGWAHGAIGVEIKRSGTKLGPWLAQAMDYVRSVFEVGGVLIQPGAVFLWPCEKQFGPIESVMVHNRVGTVTSSRWNPLLFQFGGETVLRVTHEGAIEMNDRGSGRKVGSR